MEKSVAAFLYVLFPYTNCIPQYTDNLLMLMGGNNTEERFNLIYENYSVFPQLVDCF